LEVQLWLRLVYRVGVWLRLVYRVGGAVVVKVGV
jgi:hypothetical protein